MNTSSPFWISQERHTAWACEEAQAQETQLYQGANFTEEAGAPGLISSWKTENWMKTSAPHSWFRGMGPCRTGSGLLHIPKDPLGLWQRARSPGETLTPGYQSDRTETEKDLHEVHLPKSPLGLTSGRGQAKQLSINTW